MKEKYAKFRHAKVVEVLKIEVNEGEGTQEDPINRVVYLTTLKGKLLATLRDDEIRKFAGEDEMINLDN